MRLRKLITILCDRYFLTTLIAQRVAAGIEHKPVLKNLDAQTVVDIGANRGQFALAARRWCRSANIFSFEPLMGPREIFKRVFGSDERTQVFPAAIGPSAGNAVMHVSARDDSSSLLPIGVVQTELFPGTQEVGVETVEVGRLSQYLQRARIQGPALLKIDVQGFELSTLMGCEDVIQCFKWVYVEASFVEFYDGQALAGDVIAWLGRHNYSLSGVYNPTYSVSGSAVQADFLFTSNSLKPAA